MKLKGFCLLFTENELTKQNKRGLRGEGVDY